MYLPASPLPMTIASYSSGVMDMWEPPEIDLETTDVRGWMRVKCNRVHQSTRLSGVDWQRNFSRYVSVWKFLSVRNNPSCPAGRIVVDALEQNLKFAARQVWRNPGFTVTVILTLALSIGANTAI